MELKFNNLRMYNRNEITDSGRYLAVDDEDRLYTATYDADKKTLYFTISTGINIIGYIAVAELPTLSYKNVTVGGIFIYDGHWVRCQQLYPVDNLYKVVQGLAEGGRYASLRIYPQHISIAIDGPAGAGKTTQAKLLAQGLRFLYVDTGAMYRTVALAAIRAPGKSIESVLESMNMHIVRDADGQQVMLLGAENVTKLLRTQDISKMASDLSAMPCVRDFLLEKQRELARDENVVMEGRDIGTVVLPEATVKIFLTADLLFRAGRRVREMKQKGEIVDPIAVASAMLERDQNDMSREVAPLKKADSAVEIDCSELNIKTTYNCILDVINQAMGSHATEC